mmetsp:Transcript_34741/g.55685  ORF Transcript_34741/g.55685 Transcript_34741/m.55685 type:complete len:203 (+) Transcript_34741:718-1326(+)
MKTLDFQDEMSSVPAVAIVAARNLPVETGADVAEVERDVEVGAEKGGGAGVEREELREEPREEPRENDLAGRSPLRRKKEKEAEEVDHETERGAALATGRGPDAAEAVIASVTVTASEGAERKEGNKTSARTVSRSLRKRTWILTQGTEATTLRTRTEEKRKRRQDRRMRSTRDEAAAQLNKIMFYFLQTLNCCFCQVLYIV